MCFGKFETFSPLKDDWTIYVERLELYFTANGVKENLKVATLLTVMGSEAYDLLVTLCTPETPTSKSFEELVEIMKDHLQPRPNVLAERYKFKQRKQAAGESVADYVAELNKLARTCNFGTWLTESLRDQFVYGLSSDGIRQRLFVKEDLKFDTVFKLARAMEAADAEALVEGVSLGKGNHEGGSPSTAGHDYNHLYDYAATGVRGKVKAGMRCAATRGQTSRGRIKTPTLSPQPHELAGGCKVCGAQHISKTCKYSQYVCGVCNQTGHLKTMCPKLRVSNYQAVNLHDGKSPKRV